MKYTDKQLSMFAVLGFLGLIVTFIIGAVTIVLMPFALLYAIGYLIALIYLFVLYLKNRPDEAKAQLKGFVDFCCDPQVVHESAVRRSKKAAAKRRKKQIKRSKRQARRLALAYSANKALKDFMK
ncbi:hypothetical protein [Eubacterium coprostanoligenes]|uniref:Uncharacterized protein n=1 Tax=Eubacterium coprostanoligenes TaxID=290054 RepID=A0A1T4JTB6_9FIRM|nr:hypothetical protein [Eubacterium coprostanoligenes]SJZ33383.1 hypothetical protein SAMN02745114_00067 [Eubacterium coprostanoligenes]